MTPDQLAKLYPYLYHMAEDGTWPSIQRIGLLSTSALLDKYEVKGSERRAIEEMRRPNCVEISNPRLGSAVIRDQKPLSENALGKCLIGMTVVEWYKVLNGRVFFWVSLERLLRLLQARAYRGRSHCVLTVDTRALLRTHVAEVTLSAINSGSTVYKPQSRGSDTFCSIEQYPFDSWREKRKNKDVVVELAVNYSVPCIRDYVTRVTRMKNGKEIELLWLPSHE